MRAHDTWGEGFGTAILNIYQSISLCSIADPRNPPTHLHSDKIILCSLTSHMGNISSLKVYIFLLFLSTLKHCSSPSSLLMPSSLHTFSLISSAFMILTNTRSPQIFPFESWSVLLSFDLLYLPAYWTDFKLRRSELKSSSPTSTPQTCCSRS